MPVDQASGRQLLGDVGQDAAGETGLQGHGTSGGTGVFMEEIGPGTMVNFRITASDPHGLGGVELMEWVETRTAASMARPTS